MSVLGSAPMILAVSSRPPGRDTRTSLAPSHHVAVGEHVAVARDDHAGAEGLLPQLARPARAEAEEVAEGRRQAEERHVPVRPRVQDLHGRHVDHGRPHALHDRREAGLEGDAGERLGGSLRSFLRGGDPRGGRGGPRDRVVVGSAPAGGHGHRERAEERDRAEQVHAKARLITFRAGNPTPNPSPRRGGEGNRRLPSLLLFLLSSPPLPAAGRGRGWGFRGSAPFNPRGRRRAPQDRWQPRARPRG